MKQTKDKQVADQAQNPAFVTIQEGFNLFRSQMPVKILTLPAKFKPEITGTLQWCNGSSDRILTDLTVFSRVSYFWVTFSS
jgi:hypothetical protein